LFSGEVSRLWEQPTEAISRKRVAVGIAAIYGGEDVNESKTILPSKRNQLSEKKQAVVPSRHGLNRQLDRAKS
jgi:hypothetical protein